MPRRVPTCSTIIVMGVSGSGKTTVGRALAGELGWDFIDGDSFHSQESRASIAAGIPLTDQDREPWLARLNAIVATHKPRARGLVLACSALKKRYRDVLRQADSEAAFVYLRGNADLIAKRLSARSGHFATPAILTSQMATLEEPDHALAIDIEPDVETIVGTIRIELGV
ncbi:MAG: gluconokinase [Acidimicrobiia bacterium]|nr:MAG: gluconokinase [Acidimicrobiia bacterium]